VLWEGLPAVASATPLEVSRAIEIKELAPSSPVATTKTPPTTEKPELTTATRNVGRSDAQKVSVAHKTAKNKVTDAFQPGTIWTGNRVMFIEGTKKPTEASVTLTVRERTGEAFRARYVVGDLIREINGTIKDGQIGWLAHDVTVVKGDRGLNNAGMIKGGQITVTFSGVLANGTKRRSGTVKLRLTK
jgi:hypothetical protein